MLISLILSIQLLYNAFVNKANPAIEESDPYFNSYVLHFYNNLEDTNLNYKAFYFALKGYFNLIAEQKLHNDSVLTIIDYTKSANIPRFYMIDMYEKKLINKTFVSHGKNSGTEFARQFSNEFNSFKSAIGFFITSETYYGKHGYSLRMEGLENEINHNARNRDIVIHGAEYVNDFFIKKQGYIGRSHGCPALPKEMCGNIIERIKECSCIFAYYQDQNYLKKSRVINSNSYLIYFEENNKIMPEKKP